MAKCPKCGTRVDETSTQCHMCGTSFEGIELEGTYKDDGFADNFFAQIGGVVSSEPDTILNSVGMNVDNNDLSNTNATVQNNTFTNSIDVSSTINSDIKNEMNNNVQSTNVNINNNNDNNNEKDDDEMLSEIKHKLDREEIGSDVIIEKIHEERMKEQLEDFSAIKPANVQVSKSFIFNTACFVVFILIMIFVYFTFIKEPSSNITELGGLSYQINADFALTNANSGSNYYNYNGDNCALRVTYGSANSDGFLSSYFDTVREGFKGNEKYTFQSEEIKINNNVWTGLSVMEFSENAAASGGYESLLKYKYASIVHNASFYHIVFVNLDSDETCNTMFNDFMGTLEFK